MFRVSFTLSTVECSFDAKSLTLSRLSRSSSISSTLAPGTVLWISPITFWPEIICWIVFSILNHVFWILRHHAQFLYLWETKGIFLFFNCWILITVDSLSIFHSSCKRSSHADFLTFCGAFFHVSYIGCITCWKLSTRQRTVQRVASSHFQNCSNCFKSY